MRSRCIDWRVTKHSRATGEGGRAASRSAMEPGAVVGVDGSPAGRAGAVRGAGVRPNCGGVVASIVPGDPQSPAARSWITVVVNDIAIL